MEYLIVIVLPVVLGLFMSFPNRFRHHFENWILSRPKPYVLYVLCFGYLGCVGYSIYKSIKGEEIGSGNFLSLEYFPLTLLLLLYLNSLWSKRFEIDKVVLIKRKNPTDYFKNKQQQQKEWIEKPM